MVGDGVPTPTLDQSSSEPTLVNDGHQPSPQERPGPSTPAVSKQGQEIVGIGDDLDDLSSHDEWTEIVSALNVIPMVREFASNCFLEGKDGPVIQLGLSQRHETFRSENNEAHLKQALSDHFGEQIALRFSVRSEVQNTPAQKALRRAEQAQLQAEASIENDGVVHKLKAVFGATVLPGTIKPVKAGG